MRAMPKRRSSEPGHRRKFLVVIDDTPECDRAVYFASRRARQTGGSLVMLYVMPPGDYQHWLGVETIMRAEAQDEARRVLGEFAEKARKWAGIEPELVIREGNRAEELLAVIEEDEDIVVLVLAASAGKEGPGPLVSAIVSRSAGTYPIPITIVPGSLSDEEIEALS
ncbi:nucleotide-binding universal stress UspA family protein [Tepidamorphus gemmatus]|jgi:nucleotide-binding universal stress UspA family protein|uniref:Nucleotide-binding universal stress UspA family protein n=2 Tax=Tepidamorphus gemmatus TaxID=747076 RepID=A0A4R3MHS0_9HYPH|nr:nucleotide-binding universal stress UspA family protein [Tepidamorphus gemmatus]